MHFPDLTDHHTRARARTKSVPFTKAIFGSRESLHDDPPARPSSVPALSLPERRSVSLTVRLQEIVPSIRHYKSMLDVDEAPKLPATQPMTYDELYVEPLTEQIHTPSTRALEIAKYWKSPRSPCSFHSHNGIFNYWLMYSCSNVQRLMRRSL